MPHVPQRKMASCPMALSVRGRHAPCPSAYGGVMPHVPQCMVAPCPMSLSVRGVMPHVPQCPGASCPMALSVRGHHAPCPSVYGGFMPHVRGRHAPFPSSCASCWPKLAIGKQLNFSSGVQMLLKWRALTWVQRMPRETRNNMRNNNYIKNTFLLSIWKYCYFQLRNSQLCRL